MDEDSRTLASLQRAERGSGSRPSQDVRALRPSSRLLPQSPPLPTLPKGGGAIRGIGETFTTIPARGGASLSIPVPVSPGRPGLTPELSLNYDPGSGNGPFGLGWSITVPSITRKTDKGLPKYDDEHESDTFILSGAEDLVPEYKKDAAGNWLQGPDGNPIPNEEQREAGGRRYRVRRYRPRTEGLFARVERWTRIDDGEIHWRSISKDNVVSYYGMVEEGAGTAADPRIANPSAPQRVFSWLLCGSHDDKGNAVLYQYKAEDSEGVDTATANESNRTKNNRASNRYLKRILYGNATSLVAGGPISSPLGPGFSHVLWYFEVVLDYGEGYIFLNPPQKDDKGFPIPAPSAIPEGDLVVASSAESEAWSARQDIFSSYRPTFEVRTYRLCRRFLMFHHIESKDGLDAPGYLVKSLDLDYDETAIATTLRSATICGYVQSSDGMYLRKPLPPLEMEYSASPLAAVRPEDFRAEDFPVQDLEPYGLENVPAGTWSGQYRWIDLDGEGIAGLLSEQADAWYFKPNLGAGKLNGLRKVSPLPALADLLSPRQHLMDLNGDGLPDLVELGQPVGGYYQRSEDSDWEAFRPFHALPNLEWQDPDIHFADLTGDGLADVFVAQGDYLTWYEALGGDGFDLGVKLRLPNDENEGPRQIAADARQAVYLADMSGDGLVDIVRIRQGEVCYWPNLGYGRFGRRVTMSGSPRFDPDGQFDPRRVQLADVDGSGPADLVYHAGDGARIYLNRAGNGWDAARVLTSVPPGHELSSLDVVDLLGSGTACLVWSSALPGDTRRSMRFVDLMKGRKPFLLVRFENNLGAETRLEYEPSTRFYLADKSEGRPWVTRLPFPVHVVTRVETIDHIGRNRFVSRFSYHHGYYDGVEREFRGFGRVDRWDTEEFALLSSTGETPAGSNIDASSHVPPVLTRTWYHTGVYLGRDRVSRLFAEEYYREPRHRGDLSGASAASLLLEDTILPPGLSVDDEREACRAIRGQTLRQETYAHDGTDRAIEPYLVSERNFTIQAMQLRAQNRHAVFFVHPREVLTFRYERNPDHPRIVHAMTLEVDSYGNTLKQVEVQYGRRVPSPDPSRVLKADDHRRQATSLVTYTEGVFTNAIDERDVYRNPAPCESRTFELTGYSLQGGKERFITSDFIRTSDGRFELISDGEIPYEAQPTVGRQKRLIEHHRFLYRRDDFTGPLPLGRLESLAVPFESYKLAFTPGLLAEIFGGAATIGVMESQAQYRHFGGDDNWWVPSGRILYSPERTDTDPQELHFARQHFFLPSRFRDPFHTSRVSTEATVRYDKHDLVVLETEDALGNRTTAGKRDAGQGFSKIESAIDYRTLQPSMIMDPNGNQSFVAFDALGMVVGSALAGKPGEDIGDSLDGFGANLSDTTIKAHLDNPLGSPHDILSKATTRIVYDLFAYRSGKGSPRPSATVVYTLSRETHESDLVSGQRTRVQHSFTYSDGSGREIQKKIQAEPGPGPRRDPATGKIISLNGLPQPTTTDVDPRWVGTGWTVFNNKGNPVRRFEPFFSDTHRFECDVHIGVSSILFYDPPGRLIATLHPNHTWEKVVFDSWTRESWDVNDTVSLAPQTDADVGVHFRRLQSSEYLPTWAASRLGGALGPEEQAAASRATAHAGTPTVAHFDAGGRAFLTIADNGAAGKYPTRTSLDIEGNPREVRDAKDRIVMQYAYDMLGNRARSRSMDAGERKVLIDASNKPLVSWDSKAQRIRTVYDPLRRAIELRLSEGNAPEIVVEQFSYGEQSANPESKNLRTRVVRRRDQAGEMTIQGYDFKGNQLDQSRRLSRIFFSTLNWEATVELEDPPYTTRSRFDAMNRPIEISTPDGSVVRPSYNEANLLQSVTAVLADDAARSTVFVSNIDYDAKGQRSKIEYGNGVVSEYEYDRLTARLARLVTRRDPSAFPDDGKQPAPAGWPGRFLQNLTYTYDPVGNVTNIRDDAQQVIFFRNARVDPSSQYTYDAVYRLVEATGREHLGQDRQPTPLDALGFNHSRIPHPSDGNAMGRYCENFVYDMVGNILEVQHRSSGAANPNWARRYSYTESSSIEPAKAGNRLSSTSVGTIAGAYPHDANGNMRAMPHLPELRWNYRDQLSMSLARLQTPGTGAVFVEATYYSYDSEGQRARKVTVRQDGTRKSERIYLGSYEVHRNYDASGQYIVVERRTLHVSDDRRRIAMVERRSIGSEGDERLIRYQLVNHIGSACVELDQAGQVISYEEYFPYGATSYQAVRGQLEANPKRYRYVDKERDEESGLYYYGARYYASWLGRWTSPDPAELLDHINPYVYTANNPVNSTDPHGLWTWRQATVVGAAVTVGVVVTVATAGAAAPIAAAAVASFGLTGTVATLAAGATVGAVAGAAGGAAAGAAGEATRQMAEGENISGRRILGEAGTGAAWGAGLGAAAPLLSAAAGAAAATATGGAVSAAARSAGARVAASGVASAAELPGLRQAIQVARTGAQATGRGLQALERASENAGIRAGQRLFTQGSRASTALERFQETRSLNLFFNNTSSEGVHVPGRGDILGPENTGVGDHVVSVPRSPITDVPRMGSALKADPHHAFPDIVDNFAGDAQRFSIPTKGPGGMVIRQSELYQLGGELRGKPGIFEWVVDQGAVTHRRFIPGGQITGFPNQVPGVK